MEKANPALVIMAAGLGSRFGGLKQIAPIDDAGHIIIDYSIYDAVRAGFRDVVCIINPANEKDFTEHLKGFESRIGIKFAHQTLDMLPSGFKAPEGRVKPWGTAHAILSAKEHLHGPFAVINADDFYGAASFKLVHDFLEKKASDASYAVVGYRVENTLTDSGSVTRGVLEVRQSKLTGIQEIMQIVPAPGGAAYLDGGQQISLPEGTMVSMNMWGFGHGLLAEIETRFAAFLENSLRENPMKCEFLLPTVVGDVLGDKKAEVEVLPSVEKWYGVTYAEDMPGVKSAIGKMRSNGIYPMNLREGK